MNRVRPKYLSRETNRHGNERLYVRIRGRRARLPNSRNFNSAEFRRAYRDACELAHKLADESEAGSDDPINKGEVIPKIVTRLVTQSRKRSVELGRHHTITEDDIYDLFDRQDLRCAVSGLSFRFSGRSRDPRAPSIDRIACARGYTRDNIRLVLTAVNIGISDWGDQEYRQICFAVTRFARKRK